MTIFKDGLEQEKIHLHEINDKEKLHALFVEKGFVKMSPEESKQIQADRRAKSEQEKLTAREQAKSNAKHFSLRKNSRTSDIAARIQRIKDMKGDDATASAAKVRGTAETSGSSSLLASAPSSEEWKMPLAMGLLASVLAVGGIAMSRGGRRKKMTGRR
uniref:Uncharacterized protein n=1 Tax=Entomoneis paludosa TaxID=265537 RepID=A0A7S2YAG6_9STRA|mmetsp:Transcript_24925/g.51799  ORF Transcript_24925/g.51799 Transcript_24925/m.51799 type:complete len:159 (+) Transcript_24925:237-713(+)